MKLLSRRGRDETARYPDLVPDLAKLDCAQAVLDGEIVVLDPGGAPNFGLLQPRINLTRAGDIAAAARQAPAQLLLFDILRLDGDSLLRRPYEERRELLEALQPGARVAGAGAAGLRGRPDRGDGDVEGTPAGGRRRQASRLDLPGR